MYKRNTVVSALLLTAMLITSLPARADIVGTEQMLTQDARALSLSRIHNALARDEVAAQLSAWGVAPETVTQRVAALSDVELQQLAASMGEDPAGGVLVVIGALFVVLIVLEFLGVTNIFRRT
ncbi:MAG: PA2779 family protein [Pseudomonadales bacterium]